MSLDGSLDSFGLPDVLSLLAMTAKTGHLMLRREDVAVRGRVSLREGALVAACADDRASSLARRYIAAGLVDEAAVGSVEQPRSADMLVAAAGLDAPVAAGIARDQVLDAVFELLRWPGGSFSFSPEPIEPSAADADVVVTEAIAEAQQRLSGWAGLTARLPGPETVLSLSLTADAPSCTPEDWTTLALLDGHRTLAEAVSLSAYGEWRTLNVVAGLVDRGLVVGRDDARSLSYRAGLMARIGAAGGGGPVAPAVIVADAGLVTADAPQAAAGSAGSPGSPGLAAGPSGDAAPSAVPDEAVAVADVPDVPSQPEAPVPATTFAELQDAEVADAPASAGDGVDDALLQRLIAGVRAL